MEDVEKGEETEEKQDGRRGGKIRRAVVNVEPQNEDE